MVAITRILAVDDSPFICSLIERALHGKCDEIICVNSAIQALEWVSHTVPDCILLDLVLPDMDGYALCERLLHKESLEDVPILFITSECDEKSLLRGFEVGAADYIAKPFSCAELQARVSSHLKSKLMKDELRQAYARLEQAMSEIRLQGMKDPLTNLFNRRYFLENMESWRRVTAGKGCYAILLDVDRFKQVNDVYGHFTGDYVLYTVADIILQTIGENAVGGRWGGDEFLAILTETDDAQARVTAQSLVDRVSAHDFCYDNLHFPCSISVGLARLDPAVNIESNIANADEALYAAKKAGRGRYCLYGSE